MVSLENYQLQYDIFLAEQELFDSLIDFGANYVIESSGLISIHEGVKETILGYLQKIAKALETAWEKFKEIVTRKKDIIYLKSIQKKMENPDPKFTINNYPIYDITMLDNISIAPFNYEQMKDDLESSTSFINKYYSAFNKDPDKSLQENISNLVLRTRQDQVKCTGTILKNMYNFALQFPDKITKMEKDLKTVNASNKNIENMVSQITPAQTTNEASVIYESYLMEAEDDNNKKVKFEDDEDAKKTNTTLVKQVTTYLKVSSDILSAKMKCYRDIYAFYMQTIKHYIKPEPEESSEKKETETSQTTGQTQIKI